MLYYDKRMKYFILVMSFAIILFFLYINFKSITVENTKINEKELFSLIQEFRYENNLTPYMKSKIMCEYASIRLAEIRTDFSHDGFKNMKHPPCTTEICNMGENLARGQNSEQELLTAWLNSPSHAENLYRDYKYSCIRTDGVYTVHFFGTF